MVPRAKTCARDTAEVIQTLNDRLRVSGRGGRTMITSGVVALPEIARGAILAAVRGYDGFSERDDPYGEHDMGSVTVSGHRVFWKIDYYDRELRCGSRDPANPSCTTRVLTIMLASEY